MDNTFVGSEPAKLRVLGKLMGNLSELCHQFFDFASDKAGTQHPGSFANQLVASAQSKCDSRAEHPRCCKERCREGILGTRMDRVSARAALERKPNIASFDRNDVSRHHE